MREKIKKIGTAVFVIGIIFILKPCIQVIAETSTDEFTYTVNDTTKEATITGYTGTQEDLTIPNIIDGYKVISIGSKAFRSNNTIRSIIIPGEIETIDRLAFEWCDSLEKVIIKSGCKTIKSRAFSCKNLSYMEIPKSVTELEYLGDSINEVFSNT
ncbi:hypothetical protein CG709_16885, partial [Lachnotalea glycerini]